MTSPVREYKKSTDDEIAILQDRSEKLRFAKQRQHEERQRKIEDLKAQAEAAQRYREQKEEERRHRIDEIRNRDIKKRQQVEERKKSIMEAEKERRDYILKKNQERDSKLELKKKSRNPIATFAFGSSTPRLLEPADFGVISPSTFWGHKRSTSISNVACGSLSRRSSERELIDCGYKKRATSASGTDRQDEDKVDSSHIVFRSVARRKTDLMPAIPNSRDGYYSSRSSLNNTPRTPGSRSGNVTPGGSVNTTRAESAMSTNLSLSGYVPRRSVTSGRKSRPASIAGTGISLQEINKIRNENKPPLKTSSQLLTKTTPKRMPNTMSTSLIGFSSSSHLSSAEKRIPVTRNTSTPKCLNPKPLSKTPSFGRLNKFSKEQNDFTASVDRSDQMHVISALEKTNVIVKQQSSTPVKAKREEREFHKEINEERNIKLVYTNDCEVSSAQIMSHHVHAVEKVDQGNEKHFDSGYNKDRQTCKVDSENSELTVQSETTDAMTASGIARNKIITEEEAKAALAERRRLAREEAVRLAELERQRLETKRLAKIKQQEDDVERQRQFEEEAIRLALEQRRSEEERLRQAIKEANYREENDRVKREDEEKHRLEREEAEKKAKEETEKQRLEVDERLKREEKERDERRKRVEAIMTRTRKAGAANSVHVKENDEQLKIVSNEHIQHLKLQILTTTENKIRDECRSVSSAPKATILSTSVVPENSSRPKFSQAMYEQLVAEKEASLMKNFSTVDDENIKNLQEHVSTQQQDHLASQNLEICNGKWKISRTEFPINKVLLSKSNTAPANGNAHVQNINIKNDINIIDDVIAPVTNQLFDLSVESQIMDNSSNCNNNILLSTSSNLVRK